MHIYYILKITSSVLWRHNKDVIISLDISNIIFEHEDYINSTNRRNHYTVDKIYGLAAIKELCKHFCEAAQNDLDLDESYLHKFLIHKSYMKSRIECLISNGIINEEWGLPADQVAKNGETVFDLGRNFNGSHDKSLIGKLVEAMVDSIELETNYLPYVLENIKKHNQTK